ncbi:MAG: acyl-CoA dehydrogenase [Gammaproteobacteria bacterium]|jgi:acyl-CoA dehydrogenase
MSERDLIVATAERLFTDFCTPSTILSAESGVWPGALWDAIEDSGLHLASVPESYGGSGAQLLDAFNLLIVAGSYTTPVPLAETFLAAWVLGNCELVVPSGPLTIVPPGQGSEFRLTRQSDAWRLSGVATRVPFARHVGGIVLVVNYSATDYVITLTPDQFEIVHGTNMANEARDSISCKDVIIPDKDISEAADPVSSDTLTLMSALARACQMAGALDRVLFQSINYVIEREQFGRPLAKFQAIQHHVATLAGEAAAATVAAQAAAQVVDVHGIGAAELEIAAAKSRIGTAAGLGAELAHQVHGAMGFTQEYPLHYATRRLWSWRDEFGNEAYWTDRLATLILRRGGDEVWPALTARAGISSRISRER